MQDGRAVRNRHAAAPHPGRTGRPRARVGSEQLFRESAANQRTPRVCVRAGTNGFSEHGTPCLKHRLVGRVCGSRLFNKVK